MKPLVRLYHTLLIVVCALVPAVNGLRGQTPQRPADYDSRISALEQARRAQPQNLAVLRTLADSYGMGAEYAKAIPVVQEILAIEGPSSECLLRLARLYAWSGKPDSALVELRQIGDHGSVDAVELECQILTAKRRADEAASCYQRLQPRVSTEPAKNSAVLLALARNQAWAGRSQDATRSYENYLRTRPEDRAATIELIRLSRYRGDYARAEKLCNRLLETNPADAEVLALKAEVLHWAGHRKLTARRSATQAATLDPNLPDAKVAQIYALLDVGSNREARQEFLALQDQVTSRGGLQPDTSFHDAYRLLEGELAHPTHAELNVPFSTYNDVDGIHDTFSGLQFTVPLNPDRLLHLNLEQYVSSAPLSSIFTAGRSRSSVREFTASGTIWSSAGVLMNIGAGSSARSSGDGLRPIFNWNAKLTPADHWSFDFSAGREFLKLTPRAIDLDMSSYQTAGTARYAFDSRTTLSVQAERRWWSDANRSVGAGAIFDRNLHYYKRFLLHGGFLTRHEAFERDAHLSSGFFTPDHYQRHEGHLGANGEAGRLRWELRASGGAQQILQAADYRPSWDVTSSVSLRLTRGLRLFGNYQRRNYSLLAKDGWYQGFFITLGIQP